MAPTRSMWCALNSDAYHRLADVTIEGVQEVYEDEADDNGELNMEVECSVRVPRQSMDAHRQGSSPHAYSHAFPCAWPLLSAL